MQSITSNPAVQKISVFAAVLAATGLLAGAVVSAQTGGTTVSSEVNSYTKEQCKDGGWQTFGEFKNQGECVSYFAKVEG